MNAPDVIVIVIEAKDTGDREAVRRELQEWADAPSGIPPRTARVLAQLPPFAPNAGRGGWRSVSTRRDCG
mgnify:CR=1 FL=1